MLLNLTRARPTGAVHKSHAMGTCRPRRGSHRCATAAATLGAMLRCSAPAAAAEDDALTEVAMAEQVAAAAAAADAVDDKPDPAQAARYLDCEGLGEANGFWPEFRRALARDGPLGKDAVQLAHGKWGEWERLVEAIDEATQFDGQVTIPLPGEWYLNGSVVETPLRDRMDLITALQRARLQALFGEPPPWGPDDLAGFLACPIGFVH